MRKLIVLILIFIILILPIIFKQYERHFRCNITAKFTESGPLYIKMPVYYKGYKIGETKNIKPSDDYQSTLVKIMLYPRNPKLPENIIAKVKKQDTKQDYLELTPPDEPSAKFLKNGSVIEGEPAFDLESLLSEIMDSGTLDPIIESASDLLSSISDTSDEIGRFFSNSNLVLKDNKQNIKYTTKSLASTSKSLTEITSRINTSLTQDQLNNTISNVDKSSTNIVDASENIKNITSNVDNATKNLNKTMAKIDSTICNVNASASNVKNITGGFCEVLGKRFAGLRIIFGKPINKNTCSKNCTK